MLARTGMDAESNGTGGAAGMRPAALLATLGGAMIDASHPQIAPIANRTRVTAPGVEFVPEFLGLAVRWQSTRWRAG